ncbi:response regulator, partial [Chromobacterium piscinae]
RRVLVVDDDPRNLFVVTAALERHGAKLNSAVNGRRALEFLEQQSADLVLMDIMMPEMDGYQAIAAIRANPAWMDLPVVAITAKALPAEREKILATGADDYLSKPVDYDLLVAKVAQWCEGRG